MSNTKSLSCDKMVKSNEWDEIAILGKHISNGLKVNEHGDTLRKWMSYYLADLLIQEESEKNTRKKKVIRKECSDLIIRLWSLRFRYDSDDPINILNEKLRIFTQKNFFHSLAENKSTLLLDEEGAINNEDILQAIMELSEEEKEIIFFAQTACMAEPEDLPDLTKGLDGYRRLFEIRKSLLQNTEDDFLSEIDKANNEQEVREILKNALLDINSRRQELIERIN